jgi:hypothetical protein
MMPDRRKIWDDPQRLEDWTNAALDGAQFNRPFENIPRMSPSEWNRWLVSLALSDARDGRPERLWNLCPQLDSFKYSPPLKRGQRRKPQFNPFVAYAFESALDDIPTIKQIWREHFGKTHAPPDGPSALAIVARRHGMDEDELLTFRKNLHRRS